MCVNPDCAGYYYDAGSGYYYDANTGLYYHPTTQQWYSYDQSTGQYTTVSSTGTSTAGQAALASAENVVNASKAIAAKPAARKGAVIGAAPQLNPQGLLAAAHQLVRACVLPPDGCSPLAFVLLFDSCSLGVLYRD